MRLIYRFRLTSKTSSVWSSLDYALLIFTQDEIDEKMIEAFLFAFFLSFFLSFFSSAFLLLTVVCIRSRYHLMNETTDRILFSVLPSLCLYAISINGTTLLFLLLFSSLSLSLDSYWSQFGAMLYSYLSSNVSFP